MNISEIIEARWTTSSLKDIDGKLLHHKETIHCKLAEDGSHYISIPKDPENTDYQDLMRWVDEGNTIKEPEEE